MPSPKRTPPSFISEVSESQLRPPAPAGPRRWRCRCRRWGRARGRRRPAPPRSGRAAGAGRRRSWLMERAQPVAPVPVATMTPEEDWRSSRPPRTMPVARRLVAPVAGEELVERQEPLAVVEARLHHGARLEGSARPAAMARRSAGDLLRPVRRQHAVVPLRLRVDAEHRLAGEVLGGVGDQPVLADRHHEVARLEDEAGQVGPVEPLAPPLGRDGPRDGRQRRLQPGVAPLQLGSRRLAAPLEVEGGLGRGCRGGPSSAVYSLGRVTTMALGIARRSRRPPWPPPLTRRAPGAARTAEPPGPGLQEPLQRRAEGALAEVEVLDPVELGREGLRRHGVEHRRAGGRGGASRRACSAATRTFSTRSSARGLGLAAHRGGVRLGVGQGAPPRRPRPPARCARAPPWPRRRCGPPRPPPRPARRPLRPFCSMSASWRRVSSIWLLQLVLLDGPLLLDRQGAAGEDRLVGLLLDALPGRRLQGLLHVRVGAHRADPHRDQLQPHVPERRVPGEAGLDPLADLLGPLGEDLADGGAGHQRPGVLLGELGDQELEPLQRLVAVEAAGEVDGEVDPPGEALGIGHPEGDHPLHRHVLEVGGAAVEEEGHLPVVGRHLGDGGRGGEEAEGEPAAGADELAAPVLQDEGARVGAQVLQEADAADLGHGALLLSWTEALRRAGPRGGSGTSRGVRRAAPKGPRLRSPSAGRSGSAPPAGGRPPPAARRSPRASPRRACGAGRSPC